MLLKKLLLSCCLLTGFIASAKTIWVKNTTALTKANKEAKPGDIIIIRNGEWSNAELLFNCTGTPAMPITFRAETAGKVLLTGNSKLKIGGSYLVIDGLCFRNGFSGTESVISFKSSKDEIATHCRVTNTVIDDYNNPKRLNENYWVSFYGKNNRIDHCSFLNKKNMGVLLAVILEDDRSRENFHQIDHNYFGVRIPLASNTGEIIRVGVSEHCQFNSNTQITDNFFEHCDGETEIISIKSCKNLVKGNFFKECQGGVVLRHGNYNTVENNIFYGNGKQGTGGVRIINKGQWVVNNLFYKCRGEGFRSPMSIMNGIPNSPANRYLEVSEAVISNNSFFECTPISFCEGSDAERTVAPHEVSFLNNLFYNSKDSVLYNVYDNISGIHFSGNVLSKNISQEVDKGFLKTAFQTIQKGILTLPDAGAAAKNIIPAALQTIGEARQISSLSSTPGIGNYTQFQHVLDNAKTSCGAKWLLKINAPAPAVTVSCNTANDVIQALALHHKKIIITLTAGNYVFHSPLNINTDVIITSAKKQEIKLSIENANAAYCIQVMAGHSLQLKNLHLDLTSSATENFICTDSSGLSNHLNFSMSNCSISNSNSVFFKASRSSVCDSIIISNCQFENINADIFKLDEETDKKGYYNVENMKINNTLFSDIKGSILTMLRSGKDESTMGPQLLFSKNTILNCTTSDSAALISLSGIQYTIIDHNNFTDCNAGKSIIQYEDWVRAVHYLSNNIVTKSGRIITNQFVQFKK